MMQRPEYPPEVWAEALRQLATLNVPLPYEMIGKCWTCGAFRVREQCRQVVRDECCVYACRTCGATVDESPPF